MDSCRGRAWPTLVIGQHIGLRPVIPSEARNLVLIPSNMLLLDRQNEIPRFARNDRDR